MNRRDYGWITDDIRDTAVQAVLTAIERGLSLTAACTKVAMSLEVHTNTVKNWARASGKLDELRTSADSEVVAKLYADIEAMKTANSGLLAALKEQQRRS
ncbi:MULTISPECIES: hypothetical protein [Gordonia]|nr:MULTISPECIES: hypothetical protein [Gordonia]WFN95129.1 hypothetical protein P5P27_20380 [Gordonia sihwensis]WFN95152.1 hypothetical protein P5P27_20520 [Gordonia sihwensis]